MSQIQLTLDNDRFTVTNKRRKIAWATPPIQNPEKVTFFRAVQGDNSPIYDLIDKVVPDISAMYPEMKGIVIGIRVMPMSWCLACWDYSKDEIDFDSGYNWTEKQMGETFAHELTHAYHSKINAIPGGEKATDVFMLSKVPLKYLARPSYLECAREPFENPERIQELAKQAIDNREKGMRQYIQWFEDQVNKIYYDSKGEPMPKRTRSNYAAWGKKQDVESHVIVKTYREREEKVLLALMELEKQNSGAVLRENLFTHIEAAHKIVQSEAEKSLTVLLREGTVYEPREGYIRKT